jgi:hypothetical protein
MMVDDFRQAGLFPTYPFNDSSHDYEHEMDKTKNAARMAWVRKHAQEEV